ncbi:MAG: hypothetical protein ABSB70_10255 [Candidatus Velthaea sp.]|jgi:hypothetical protein
MFDLSSRSAIAMLSALGAAAAIGLTPSPPQRLLVATAGPPLPRVLQSVADPVAPVLVVRDPFAEPTPPAVLAATLPVRLPHRQFGPQLSETVEPLPNNLASDTIPALPDSAPDPDPAAPRVSALVTGPHPYAMLDTGGIHEIKGLGDRVGGVTIVSIGLDGVRLRDGKLLGVDPAARP